MFNVFVPCNLKQFSETKMTKTQPRNRKQSDSAPESENASSSSHNPNAAQSAVSGAAPAPARAPTNIPLSEVLQLNPQQQEQLANFLKQRNLTNITIPNRPVPNSMPNGIKNVVVGGPVYATRNQQQAAIMRQKMLAQKKKRGYCCYCCYRCSPAFDCCCAFFSSLLATLFICLVITAAFVNSVIDNYDSLVKTRADVMFLMQEYAGSADSYLDLKEKLNGIDVVEAVRGIIPAEYMTPRTTDLNTLVRNKCRSVWNKRRQRAKYGNDLQRFGNYLHRVQIGYINDERPGFEGRVRQLDREEERVWRHSVFGRVQNSMLNFTYNSVFNRIFRAGNPDDTNIPGIYDGCFTGYRAARKISDLHHGFGDCEVMKSAGIETGNLPHFCRFATKIVKGKRLLLPDTSGSENNQLGKNRSQKSEFVSIYIVENFLTPTEADEIAAKSKPYLRKITHLNQGQMRDFHDKRGQMDRDKLKSLDFLSESIPKLVQNNTMSDSYVADLDEENNDVQPVPAFKREGNSSTNDDGDKNGKKSTSTIKHEGKKTDKKNNSNSEEKKTDGTSTEKSSNEERQLMPGRNETAEWFDASFRDSETYNLDYHDWENSFNLELEERISAAVSLPPSFGEGAQVQRYRDGAMFRRHVDFFPNCADARMELAKAVNVNGMLDGYANPQEHIKDFQKPKNALLREEELSESQMDLITSSSPFFDETDVEELAEIGRENFLRFGSQHGNRFLSAFVYLSDEDTSDKSSSSPDEGVLRFPRLTTEHDETKVLEIRPKKGSLVVFKNLLPDGTGDWDSEHESLPIIKEGKEKLVLSKIFRDVTYSPHLMGTDVESCSDIQCKKRTKGQEALQLKASQEKLRAWYEN